ncbi:MAG: nitroreductase family protein, partial [Methylovulum sp.]|nr:nitroreductase family protein [Methylovulum sp.]
MNPLAETVLNYHHRTKHTLQRYAKGPETLAWDDQPDPFRHFSGCQIVAFPKLGRELEVLFNELDHPHTLPVQPLTLDSIGLLLELAFGLSAWKQFGPNRWALRCNPSSGNLHPTEAYVLSADSAIIPAGVYHYVSYDHHLEQRCQFAATLPEGGLFIGLSSIHWREAWKYGERAFRYCQHDIGHALGALRYAAATLGWRLELCSELADAELAQLLGLDRADDFKKKEHEAPDVLCRILVAPEPEAVPYRALSSLLSEAVWTGAAQSLRAYHLYHWPVIDEVAAAAIKPVTAAVQQRPVTRMPLPAHSAHRASSLIRQRRSAQQFDGKMSPLPSTDFYRLLSALLPDTAAFGFWPWSPKVHLFIFVHRVEGLVPGLYALLRDDTALPALLAATLSLFDWQRQSDDLPFYHLYSGDLKQTAKTLSCHQPIASDSAFSLAMVAEFRSTVEAEPWRYRQLFWECGLIGQVLYLEAEAA